MKLWTKNASLSQKKLFFPFQILSFWAIDSNCFPSSDTAIIKRMRKVFTDSSNIKREINTKHAKFFHRERLKPIKLIETPEDLKVINALNFQPNSSIRQDMEPDLFEFELYVFTSLYSVSFTRNLLTTKTIQKQK